MPHPPPQSTPQVNKSDHFDDYTTIKDSAFTEKNIMRQFLAKASHNLGLVGRPSITARTPAITIASAQISTASTAPKSGNTTQTDRSQAQGTEGHKRSDTIKKHKSMAELDEELRLKLEGMSGEGGAAGVEYENGKAEGLKRGVKSNMFRVI